VSVPSLLGSVTHESIVPQPYFSSIALSTMMFLNNIEEIEGGRRQWTLSPSRQLWCRFHELLGYVGQFVEVADEAVPNILGRIIPYSEEEVEHRLAAKMMSLSPAAGGNFPIVWKTISTRQIAKKITPVQVRVILNRREVAAPPDPPPDGRVSGCPDDPVLKGRYDNFQKDALLPNQFAFFKWVVLRAYLQRLQNNYLAMGVPGHPITHYEMEGAGLAKMQICPGYMVEFMYDSDAKVREGFKNIDQTLRINDFLNHVHSRAQFEEWTRPLESVSHPEESKPLRTNTKAIWLLAIPEVGREMFFNLKHAVYVTDELEGGVTAARRQEILNEYNEEVAQNPVTTHFCREADEDRIRAVDMLVYQTNGDMKVDGAFLKRGMVQAYKTGVISIPLLSAIFEVRRVWCELRKSALLAASPSALPEVAEKKDQSRKAFLEYAKAVVGSTIHFKNYTQVLVEQQNGRIPEGGSTRAPI
jgi:hypothetical protein